MSVTAAARRRARLVTIALAALAAAATARGAGFAINDQGSRGMAFGLATAATLEGPECVFANPAALASATGWQLSFGSALLLADFSSTPEETGDRVFDSSREHFVVPHLYLVKGVGSRVALGFGLNSPFGLATEWPEDFPGRFKSRLADLKTVQLSSIVAFGLGKGWSLGLGPTWTRGDVQLVRDVDLGIFRTGHQAEANLRGHGDTPGYRAGVRWRGAKGWRFGMTLQGQSELDVDGNVDYAVPLLGAFSLDQAIMTLFQDGEADTTLTFPASVVAGVGHVGSPWTWEVDLAWTNWSTQDRVVIDLEPIEAGGQSLVVEEFAVNEWHDVVALRTGVRRSVGEKWAWAVGAYRDPSPVPARTADPLLPDSDRTSLTAGFTFANGSFAIDVAAQHVWFDALDTRGTSNEFASRYDASVSAVSVTAGWRWGSR